MGYGEVGLITILFSSCFFTYLAMNLDNKLAWLKILFGWAGYMFMYFSYGYSILVLKDLSASAGLIQILGTFFYGVTWITYFGTAILIIVGLIYAGIWFKNLLHSVKARKYGE